MHAFGGYIEGFLPAAFDVEAVCSDDRVLSFLQLNDEPLSLEIGKNRFILRRGDSDVEVRFEASPDVPMPTWPPHSRAQPLEGVDLKLVKAMLDSVPKTGWGSLNPEMLGVLVCPDGLISTDNACLAWAPVSEEIAASWKERVVLPRPFCLALLNWAAALGPEYKLRYSRTGVAAEWVTGAKLYGALPAASNNPIDFSALCNAMLEASYIARPAPFGDYLDEAAIFADDLMIERDGKNLLLETPGEMSWHRSVFWDEDAEPVKLALPLKRLRTAVEYADEIAIVPERIFLRSQSQDLYIVVGAKGGPA